MNRRSSSFEAFYDEHHDAVQRSLSAAFRDPLLAEDAAQEAFTRAYVHWRRVSRMDRPDGWVYVVAVRVAARRLPRPGVRDARMSEVDIAEGVVTQETLRGRDRAAAPASATRDRFALSRGSSRR